MSVIGDLLVRVGARMGGRNASPPTLPGEQPPNTSERGHRPTPENYQKYLYRLMWVDPDLRAAILDIREMDRTDARVKKIHGRTARAAIKGGLVLRGKDANNTRIRRRWEDFARRLRLNRPEKLESDMRGTVMEGNLPLQWVLDGTGRVVQAVRMPAETILPVVNPDGTFKDPAAAYEQHELATGIKVATFSLWQLTLVRLTPDNHDDFGSLGRPYLDASRAVWRKLQMTDEDLVVRRRTRAPLRMAHVLEGATQDDLDKYESEVQRRQREGVDTDYYMNKKGAVSAVQGDANLEQIADVVHLLDTFFVGSPAPKGLFGYAGDLNRDILEDLKRDFYDELDALQDTVSYGYQLGFELDLMLSGINPDGYELEVGFRERRTETPNQAADRALKLKALGASGTTALETAGLNPATESARKEEEGEEFLPYPQPGNIGGGQRVSITPGNQPKGESATSVSNR